jgi:hypothetical protein
MCSSDASSVNLRPSARSRMKYTQTPLNNIFRPRHNIACIVCLPDSRRTFRNVGRVKPCVRALRALDNRFSIIPITLSKVSDCPSTETVRPSPSMAVARETVPESVWHELFRTAFAAPLTPSRVIRPAATSPATAACRVGSSIRESSAPLLAGILPSRISSWIVSGNVSSANSCDTLAAENPSGPVRNLVSASRSG